MRKLSIPIAIILFMFLSTGMLLSKKDSDDTKFEKTLNSFLDELWKFYPTAATMAGYHKYDGKLEDLSEKNIEKRHTALDTFNQEFMAKITRPNLSPEHQIDHEMMIDALELELIKHENLVPWEYNPIFYNNILSNCIRSLFTKEFAPLEERAKNAADRLKKLEKLIKQAKKNLKAPPQIFTEAAIKQFPAIIDFYKNQLPQLIEQVPEAQKSKIQANLEKVLPALEDYQNFLQNELLPRSIGNFRLGPETHTRLLRLKAQNNITQDELVDRATADVNNIKVEMGLVCLPLFRIMYPEINLEQKAVQLGEKECRDYAIKMVLDKIKEDHVSKDELVNRINTFAGEIKSFIQNNQLIDLPEENLIIGPMPLESQGTSWTRLIPPGIYETSSLFTFHVAPIPEDWGEEKIQSFLEEYNNYFLYFWAIRNVYPGQFVPAFFTRKHPSIVRKMYPNLALIKGWPVFAEELLITSGFGNYNLKLRLSQLKLLFETVIDYQMELNIHQGSIEKDKAILYMTGSGYLTQAEAERKWNHIILNPGDCAYTYIGFQEIQDMEKEYKKLKGDAFSQKEYYQKLLSFGALPLRLLKKKVLEQQ